MAKEEVIIIFGADVKKLETGLKTASSKIKKFGTSVSKVGKSLSLKLTAPLVLAGGMAIKQAAKFEKLIKHTDPYNNLEILRQQQVEIYKESLLLSGNPQQRAV